MTERCLLCDQPRNSSVGLCHAHYERWRRWGKPPLQEWMTAFREGRLSTCELCGRRWNGYFGQRYCAECGAERGPRRRRDALARWWSLSPEQRALAAAVALERAQRKRAAQRADLCCRHCGGPLPPRHRAICSPACRNAEARVYHRAWRAQKYMLRLAHFVALTNEMIQREGKPDEC